MRRNKLILAVIMAATMMMLASAASFAQMGGPVEDGAGPMFVTLESDANGPVGEAGNCSTSNGVQMASAAYDAVDAQVASTQQDIRKMEQAAQSLKGCGQSESYKALEGKISNLQHKLRNYRNLQSQINDLKKRMISFDDKEDMKRLVDLIRKNSLDHAELDEILSKYVTNESLNETLNNYATVGSLSFESIKGWVALGFSFIALVVSLIAHNKRSVTEIE